MCGSPRNIRPSDDFPTSIEICFFSIFQTFKIQHTLPTLPTNEMDE